MVPRSDEKQIPAIWRQQERRFREVGLKLIEQIIIHQERLLCSQHQNVSMMMRRHVLRLERDDKRTGHWEEQLQIQNGNPETLFVQSCKLCPKAKKH